MSKRNLRLLTGLCFFTIFCLGLSITSLGPSLNAFLKNTGKDINSIKFIFIIKPLGFLIGIYWGEKILKRTKETLLLGFCFISSFFLLVYIPQVESFYLLLSALLLLGGLEGVMEISANYFLVSLHKKKVAPYMNLMHFFFGLGAIISPTLIGWDIEFNEQINNAYYILAGSFLIGGVGIFIPLEKKQSEASPERLEKNRRLIFLISLIFFFYVGAEVVYSIWIFNYSIDVASFNAEKAGYITSIYWLAFTFSRLVCVYLSTKLTNQSILNLLLGISFIIMIFFYVVPHNSLALFIVSFLLGFSFGGIFPLLLSLVEEKITLTSGMVRTFLSSACLGSILFPTILEPLYQINKLHFLNIIVLCLVFFALFLILSNREINKEQR